MARLPLGALPSLLGLLLLAPRVPAAQEMAVLPLHARGVAPAESRRLEARLLAAFRAVRGEVLPPEAVAERLRRDERIRSALEEARHRVTESAEHFRGLDPAGATERVERALSLYREHLGAYADPSGYAQAFLWRGAERLSGGNAAEARSDFLAAATLAPAEVPTVEEFPPNVVEAYELARNDGARRPLPAEDPGELSALATYLSVPALASVRAERDAEGVTLSLSLWSIPMGREPARATRVLLSPLIEPDLERAAGAAESLAAPPRPAVVLRPVEVRPDPGRFTHIPPRPPRPPGEEGEQPLWKSPWLWAGVGGVLVVGAGVGYLANQQQQQSKATGFTVTLLPGS